MSIKEAYILFTTEQPDKKIGKSKYPQNSGHPVRYYCRCQCLGSSHMVIVRLVLQPPLCAIGCQQILEMRCLLKILNLF